MNGKDLRIVFMGTPDFSVESLRRLVEDDYKVVGVITAPDKPAGRGQKLSQSAVKKYAVENELTILQPEKLKDQEFINSLKSLNADLQVVVAFRMLPEVVWDMPRLGTFNLHASLLPKYRGAAPLNWAIINGEKQSGVTTFKLQHEIDTGNVIFQENVEIGEDDNVEVLHDKLMSIGAGMVIKTVDVLASGDVVFTSQEDLIKGGLKPTPAPKIFKNDCLIDWKRDVSFVKNFIRGLSPYPSAWTNLYPADGKATSMKIVRVVIDRDDCEGVPGEIRSDLKSFLKIRAGNGWILVKELQLAGKKRMNVEDFLRGFQQIEQYTAIDR
jgi:methionyl-tRNA formyltransferase